ncbi:TPA: hypothetical protein ACS3BS_001008 [Klebsiella michiganensis]
MTSKSTREQATDTEIQMLIDSHEKGTAMFMRADAYYFMAKELQERRKADSAPVAWTEKCEITNMQATGLYLRGFPDNSHGRDIALYRHAQPAPELKPVGYLFVSDQGAIVYSPTDWGMPGFRLVGQIYGDIDVESQPVPVVPDIDELRLAFEAAERESDDGFNLHKYGIGYADDKTQGRWDTWLACRAAMLNGGKS